MQSRTLALVCSLAAVTAGCNKQFMGTAPANSPDKTYVVGSSSNTSTIWLCPTSSGDCQAVDVER